VKGGRVKTENAREEMGEQASGFSQRKEVRIPLLEAAGEEGEGEDLGVGESLGGGIVLAFGVEVGVGVVDFAKQSDDRLFQEEEEWSMLCLGHLVLLWSGPWMVFVLPHKPCNTHLAL
jgi:hypothetical protein